MRLRAGALALALVGLFSLPAAAEGLVLFVQGGVNRADPNTDIGLTNYTADSSAGTGVVAGLGLEGKLSDVFTSQVDVLWVQRSTDVLWEGEGRAPIDASYDVSYVDIPWTIRARFGSRKFRFFLTGGVVSSIAVDAKSKNTSDGIEEEFDVDEQFHGWNFSVLGGLGFDVQLGSTTWLRLEGRYLYGLKNVTSEASDWKTRDLQGLIGVGIDL